MSENSESQYIDQSNQDLDDTEKKIDELVAILVLGGLAPLEFEAMMQQEIEACYIRQYAIGRGLGETIGESEIEDILRPLLEFQFEKLHEFVGEIIDGKLSPAQIAARAKLYVSSARQAFERGRGVRLGWPGLPAYPGDGSTLCLCITSRDSLILTKSGWIPMCEIKIGDLVLTHRLRWRPVTNIIIKPSQPYHRQVFLRSPGGNWVGATDTHLWRTSQGWLDSNDICSYNGNIAYVEEVEHDGEILREMRYAPVESEQAESVHEMLDGLSMRESQGLQIGALHQLRNEQEDQRAMGRSCNARKDGRCDSGCCNCEAHKVRGYIRRNSLAEEIGRQAIHEVLGRGQIEIHPPIPVGVGTGKWHDTRRLCCSPQEWRPSGRPLGESGIDVSVRALEIARRSSAVQPTEIGGNARAFMRDMREKLLSEGKEGSSAKILFTGMLPPGTALYDIEVEEDHSFVIEGLVAHNTNCRCNWYGVRLEGVWNFYWELDYLAEHCTSPVVDEHGRPMGCLEREAVWNPLVIPD